MSRVRHGEVAGVAAVFVLLTVAFTYPQVAQLSTGVGPHYDALFSVWRLEWIAHQLATDPRHLFDANIFFPERNTLAYSDAMLLLGVAGAPLRWLGVPAVVVYNLLVLGSFVAAGTAMYLLAMSLAGNRAAAWLAAVAFAFQPYRFAHYPQLELLWTCWVPLAFWALHRVIANGRVRDGLFLGLFVAGQALTCLYYAAFLLPSIAVASIALIATAKPGSPTRTSFGIRMRSLAAGLACSVVLVAPYAIPYASKPVGHRSVDEVRHWSPTVANYVTAQSGNWVYGGPAPEVDPREAVLFPGFVVLACATYGALTGGRRALPYALLGALAFDVSLGFNGLTYPVLYETVPLYGELRVPARAFVIVSACLCVLAALGLSRWSQNGWLRRHAGWFLILTYGIEIAATPIGFQRVPATDLHTYRWLAQQPRGAVLEWPMPRTDNLGYTEMPRFMLYSTTHWQPLIGGYSGNYPVSYLRFLERVRSFPDDESLTAARRSQVRYVILHGRQTDETYRTAVEQLMRSRRVQFEFVETAAEEDLAVFTIPP